MKILIVAPRYRPYGQFYELPLGLAYISSYLKSKGKDVTFINLNEYPDDRVLTIMAGCHDVLCTGGLSVHYRRIRDIVDTARRVNRNIKIVLGGGIFSAAPEIMAKEFSPDKGIVGEGEKQLNDFLDNAVTSPIDDINELPFPDYEDLRVDTYIRRQLCGDEHYLYHLDKPRCLPIISSRSCPFSCSFCFHPLGKTYRQRSLDNFFAEVEYLIRAYRVNMLSVLDELLANDPKRLAEFCKRMEDYGIRWMTQLRADSVTEDTIKLLRRSGCFQISYGIESASNTVLESMGKNITIAQIERALQWTYDAGIGIQGNLIFGDKAETLDTARETLDWWMAHRHFMVNLTYVIPYPGCDLYKKAIERHLIFDEIDYLLRGCPTVALAPNIREISYLVESHKKLGILPCEVLSYDQMGVDVYRGPLYRMTVKCPHCDSTVTYENLYNGATNANMVPGVYRIGCRNCNQRFDILKGRGIWTS